MTDVAKISILLVEDHRVTLAGLAAWMAENDDFVIVGKAENSDSAIELARSLDPADIILLDLHLPGTRSIEEIFRELKSGRSRIVVFSAERELCTDFSTNDLKTWGLLDAIGALLERLSERSGIEIRLDNKQALPKLPQDVSLQIYRIVQESVGNAVKHSQATLIQVCANCSGSELNFLIEDNGIGFDLNKQAIGQAHKRGGMGMPIIKERTERLSALGFPSTVKIESRAGAGTKILLLLDISQQNKNYE